MILHNDLQLQDKSVRLMPKCKLDTILAIFVIAISMGVTAPS